MFLEHVEGCVKASEKSISLVLTLSEIFEHCLKNNYAGGKRLNVVLKVLSFVQGGASGSTRTAHDQVSTKASGFYDSAPAERKII